MIYQLPYPEPFGHPRGHLCGQQESCRKVAWVSGYRPHTVQVWPQQGSWNCSLSLQ